MATVIAPLPSQNGRIHIHPEPESFRPPGFRFVRWFLLLILFTMSITIALILFLGWHLGMDVTVEGKGVVEPKTRQYVKSEIGGLIQQIHVHQGQSIQKGDRIATLDAQNWYREKNKVNQDIAINRSQVTEIKAQMLQERLILEAEQIRTQQDRQTVALQLEQVRLEYELHYKYDAPIEGLSRPPINTLLPIRLRQTALLRANAELERIQRRIDAISDRQKEIQTLNHQRKKLEQERDWIKHQINRAEIYAPIHGIVLTGDLQQRIGDHIQPGESLLELSEPDNWQVRVLVSEVDIAKVQPDQIVRLYINAFPHMEYKIFEGTVLEVSHKPDSPGNQALPNGISNAVFPVKINIANPYVSDGEHTYALSYGQSVDAKIVIERGRIIDLIWKKIQKTAGKLTRHNFYSLNEKPNHP